MGLRELTILYEGLRYSPLPKTYRGNENLGFCKENTPKGGVPVLFNFI